MKNWMMRVPVLLLAGVAGRVLSNPLDEFDEFGPDWRGRNDTNTTTTTTTTTTQNPVEKYFDRIHLAYFVEEAYPKQNSGKRLPNNDQCSLAKPTFGAVYLALNITTNTAGKNCTCKKMPGMPQGESRFWPTINQGKEWYYQLAVDFEHGWVSTLRAFCSDDTCTDCQIEEAPAGAGPGHCASSLNTTTPIVKQITCKSETVAEELPNSTESRNHVVSWFYNFPLKLMEPMSQICVLEKQESVFDGVSLATFIKYPKETESKNASCAHAALNPGGRDAVIVWSSPTTFISPDECYASPIDGKYMGHVNRVPDGIHGVFECPKPDCISTSTTDCSPRLINFGVCPNEGSLAVVATDKIGNSQIGVADAHVDESIPLCFGVDRSTSSSSSSSSSSSTGPATNYTTIPGGQGSTTGPKLSPKKKKFPTAIVVVVAVIAGLVFVYVIYSVLRRRKMQRMTAYEALQDDPTF